jgi:hypothetical protein
MSAAKHEQDPRRLWQGLKPQPENIPSDIKEVEQWVLWVAVYDKVKDRTDKVPKQANGRNASVTDPATWTDYQTALAALQEQDERGPYAGLGFVLTDHDDFGALDFDHVRDATTGSIDPQVSAAVAMVGSYAEVSPSGTGIRVLFRGPLPDGPLSSPILQAWNAARFVTVTGHRLPDTPLAVCPVGAEVLRKIATTFAPKQRPTEAAPAVQVPDKTRRELRSALASMRSDDRDLWVRMGHALKSSGDVGRALWFEWSQTSEKYEPNDAARVWDSFKPTATDYRAVFAEAQRNGWANPKAGTGRGRSVAPPEEAPGGASSETQTEPSGEGEEPCRIGCYIRRGHVLHLVKTIHDRESKMSREIEIALGNFSAVVEEERQYDDGVEVDHRSFIRVTRPNGDGHIETKVEIPTAQFSNLGWVTTKLGHRHVVNAGTATKDHLRAAIQVFSHGVKPRRIFAHTGWRRIHGEWAYLHAGGAITADGLIEDMEVELPDQLAHYALPPPPGPARKVEAVRASLRQMDLIDDGVGAVQLARIYAPPLAGWYRLDVGFFIYGRTGTGKTELAAQAMAHYGAGFHARSLPGSWVSTEGALLMKAFKAKDALFEVDDFNPQGTASDHLAMSRIADKLFRGMANGAGRDRLSPDIRLRTSHVPRGVVSSSGEDLPAGRSLRARMWIVELSPKAMRLDILSECQQCAREGIFAEAMAAFLQWAAANADKLQEALPVRYEELRTAAPESLREHARIPANFAALMLGIETFLNFAYEIGAVASHEQWDLLQRCRAALTLQGAAQMEIQEESEDAVRFIGILRSAFGSGRVYVADGDEREVTRAPPTRAAQLGWIGRRHNHPEENGTIRKEIRWEPRGERIGYAVNGDLWLDPEATYTAVSKIAREQGTGALRSQIRIAKALVERGYVIKPTGSHITFKHGRSHISPSRVWKVPISNFLQSGPEEGEQAQEDASPP